MAYQMEEILRKCDMDDYRILVKQIESYVNLTSDTKLKAALSECSSANINHGKTELIHLLEDEIRYLGSSDIGYSKRKLLGQFPAGVDIDEIIEDVSAKLKVKQKLVATVEERLKRLVRWTVEKTFFSLSPEQQRELFEKAEIDKKHQEEFFEKIKNNKAHFLPLLLSILGPVITKKIIEGITVSVIAGYLGREGAKELFKTLLLRFPWWAEWLGPIVWTVSLGWLALDLQGAAYRKTIPILLYLGIVCLRDNSKDGDAFWQEPTPDM